MKVRTNNLRIQFGNCCVYCIAMWCERIFDYREKSDMGNTVDLKDENAERYWKRLEEAVDNIIRYNIGQQLTGLTIRRFAVDDVVQVLKDYDWEKIV